jgi:hypothetical protein
LPWAVRSVFLHPDDRAKSWLSHIGFVVISSVLLAAISPVLSVVPLASAVLWRLIGGSRSSLLLALASVPAAVVAVGFIYDDRGWLLGIDRRIGLTVSEWWPILIAAAALPLALIEGRARRLGFFGALLALAGLLVVRIPYGGPGIEEAALVLASFGTAIVVSAALDTLSVEPRRLLAAVTAVAILLLSVGTLLDGRLGLPGGDDNDRLSFASTLAGEGGPGRMLIVSVDPGLIPGEARPGPGFWYRALDGQGTTIDEVWLPNESEGDQLLDAAVHRIASGAELRPGLLLSQFAIDWVVIAGQESPLDLILESQLDLVPTPLAGDWRVFENPEAEPLAVSDEGNIWEREGAAFGGVAGAGRIRIAINHSDGWGPDPGSDGWRATVSASEGTGAFAGGGYLSLVPYASVGMLVLALISLIWGKTRR